MRRAIWSWLSGLFYVWRVARARRDLHALSDRMLRDIGLSRSDIDSLTR